MAVGELDVEPQSGAHRGRGAQRLAALAAHQRKAPRQHAVIGQRFKELFGAVEAGAATLDQGRDRAHGTPRKRIGALAGAGNAHAMRLDIGAPLAPCFVEELGRFQAISAYDVLFHIVDDARYERAIQNISALLSPGGVFFFSDLFLHGETLAESTSSFAH